TNLGLSLMVAAATETPVIAEADLTKHGPEASWLIDRENVLLVDEMSERRFADAAISLLRDTCLSSSIARNAKDKVLERYGMQNMLAGFFGAVQYAIAKRATYASEQSHD
ncbi:MAG: hypothetical protein AAFU85_09890, partial [Planctomycetota bacterium]